MIALNMSPTKTQAPVSLLLASALLLMGCAGSSAAGAGSEPAADTHVPVSMVPAAIPETVPAWPRWRGPTGQGLVEQSAKRPYVTRWSQSENVLWRSEVPGKGNSSPIVWDNHLFVTSATSGGKERALLAYNRSTGTKLWNRAFSGEPPEKAYPKNGHASSTPVTDGERVYVYFGNLGLAAVDFEGNVVWHQKIGPFEAFHGTASSPLLHDGRLYLVQDHGGASGSFIAAFDPATGKELWRTKRNAKVGWNSPVLIQAGERTELVMSGQKQVTAYDPKTGEELWFATGNTFEVIPTPVVGHDLLFCSSGRAGPTLAIRAGGQGDVTKSHILWSSPKGSPFVVAPIVVGEYLYMVNDMASVLTVYGATSGDVVWQTRLGTAQREGFSAAPVAVGDHVFFTNDEGETFVIRQGPEFEISHVNQMEERTLASPALVDGIWYLRTSEALYAVGEPSESPSG